MAGTSQIVLALAYTLAIFAVAFFVWGYVYHQEFLLRGYRRWQWPYFARLRRQTFRAPGKKGSELLSGARVRNGYAAKRATYHICW